MSGGPGVSPWEWAGRMLCLRYGGVLVDGGTYVDLRNLDPGYGVVVRGGTVTQDQPR